MRNKKIKVKCRKVLLLEKSLKTTKYKYFEKILYLENYFNKNNWNTTDIRLSTQIKTL